jgi:hypothetical protein
MVLSPAREYSPMTHSLVFRPALALAALVALMSLANPASAEQPEKVLRHFVLFKFKDDAPQEKVNEVVEAFQALPKKIDAILAFESGTDVSVENKAHGYTHGFLVTFRDEAGRAAYLPHPAHKAFGKLARPVLDRVLVFDYWAKP